MKNKFVNPLFFFILKQIRDANGKNVTDWTIANEFVWKDKPMSMSKLQNTNFLSKKTMKIRNKIKDMVEENIMFKHGENRKSIYLEINKNKVKVQKSNLPKGIKERFLVTDLDNITYQFDF